MFKFVSINSVCAYAVHSKSTQANSTRSTWAQLQLLQNQASVRVLARSQSVLLATHCTLESPSPVLQITHGRSRIVILVKVTTAQIYICEWNQLGLTLSHTTPVNSLIWAGFGWILINLTFPRSYFPFSCFSLFLRGSTTRQNTLLGKVTRTKTEHKQGTTESNKNRTVPCVD